MKTMVRSDQRVPRGGPFLLGILVGCVFTFALGTSATRAAGPMVAHSGTGWAVSIGYPGDKVVLPDGEHVRNRVETWKVESTNTRMSGRRTLVSDSLKKADGTTDLRGTWLGEPGTWAGSAFTGSGGIWDGSWSGVRQADGSVVLKLTARGKGGPMDGLEFKETVTRAAGPDWDPALPWALSGRTAPPNGWYDVLFEDDFEDGTVDPAWQVSPSGPGLAPLHAISRVEERNGKLTLYLDPNEEALVPYMLGNLSIDRNVRLEEGQTLEARLDLAGFGASSGLLLAVIPGLTSSEWTTSDQQAYQMEAMNTGYTWSQKAYGLEPDSDFGNQILATVVPFSAYRAGYSMVLSVTRSGPEEVALGIRVLDRNQGDAVRLARTWIDTVSEDPVSNYGVEDIQGPPYLSFRSAGFAYIMATATPSFAPVRGLALTVEKFCLRLFESSPYEFQIERAVLLTPPPSLQPYVVEGADNVNGPWKVLAAPSVEVHGRTHLVVPTSEASVTGYYRFR